MKQELHQKILKLTGPDGYTVEEKKVKTKDRMPEWSVLGVSEIGFSIALPIVAGAFFGLWVDEKFKSQPRATLTGIVVGIFFAFSSLFWWVKRYTGKNKR